MCWGLTECYVLDYFLAISRVFLKSWLPGNQQRLQEAASPSQEIARDIIRSKTQLQHHLLSPKCLFFRMAF